ncbi:MAG: cell division protein ZapA [[Actinobacillus] rossii]|uniref:Cell division protein ZapA n=1 Tax=[Actinobacillus] rossii TaxID=123820 RepID=A0A380TS14_9PAST|nr:cell division protein ZapA [[Actinobacillus] rossii]MDD7426376.1 cell division protein ZapA [[Actinobacillus] rossii]MDD7569020.1 cell division protein ZapA [[Actinobacillus] rossii]MDY3123899.1 cell division protein ZapA [[Actinobacillus] rossii]MDY4505804.1 cell division protein ZapA [[Actinobacillus] rossii]
MAMIELNFLGQVVRLNAPVEQHESLREAARILDQRVVEMKERMQTVQVERALNIVALNLSFELLQEKMKNSETEKVLQNQIQQLSASLETIFSCSTNQQTAYEIQ